MTTRRRYPACIFGEPIIRDVVDPRLKVIWERAFRQPAPFGDLRLQWKKHHCATINPYGGECPFATTECAKALLAAVDTTVLARPKVPVGYFIKVARNSAARRADEAQLMRVQKRRAEAAMEEESSDRPGQAVGFDPRYGGDPTNDD